MKHRMSAMIFTLASLIVFSDGAYALLGSDACRRVRFTVNNENVSEIIVQRFELFSVDEGRWLNEDFRNVRVPAGERGFLVQDSETVEYAEGDDISQIRVHFRIQRDGRWRNAVWVDPDIANRKCVAERTYNATVARVQ